jgi:hypothetical protein
MVHSKRIRRRAVTPLSKESWRVVVYVSKGKGVKKPREPREKEATGGTTRWKSHDA